MEEVKIIESVQNYKKRVLAIIFWLGVIIIVLTGVILFIESRVDLHRDAFYNSDRLSDELRNKMHYWEDIDYVYSVFCAGAIGICVILMVFLFSFYFYIFKMKLVVTDKRVYGKTSFGRKVDLPLDSISAIGTSMFKGIAVATSSGKIKFLGISNRDDIHKEISQLLIERQRRNKNEAAIHITHQEQSSAEELKKYKELLDSGIISQEEFDAKKKQLLGL